MLIKIIFRLIFGYLRIEIEGYYVERFINICNNNKILIWNMKRQKNVKLFLNIGIKDFKRITSIAKKTNCKVKIIKKRGIPFILHRYKKRKIFALFLIVIFCLIAISSRYIWNIDVNVEENLSIENITQDLKECGLERGILKSKVDTQKIINEIRLKRNDIAWIGIDLKGTNVKVSIVKSKEKPEIINNYDYCNIIAKKPGIITKITAQNGTAKVKVGDEVQIGDILIAGTMEGKYTELRYVHSLGEIEAKVEYRKSKEIFLEEDIYKNTGNKENKYELKFNNFTMKLYKNNSKYQYYEQKIEDKNLKLTNDFYIPISITKITNYEQNKETKSYTVEDAINLGTKELCEEIEKEIPNKDSIVGKRAEKEQKENSVIVTVIYEVIESIGENSK